MLRIAIAEDLASERDRLADYVKTYAEQRGIEMTLRTYGDGQELADAYAAGETEDLILLDIDMEQLDGISAARRIRETDERVQIVFITRMVQHALEGYEVAAADYIIKPVAYELFAGKLDRVMRNITERGPSPILLRTSQGQHYLRPEEILYAEAEGKHVRVHLAHIRQGSEVLDVTMPLYQLERQLPADNFYRCHNAFLVSLRAVTGYSQTDVYLGETRIPLSKHRRKDFTQALAAYHMKKR